jgi:transposase
MGTAVLQEIEAYDVKYMPIVRAYAEKIGLVEIVNRLVPSEMDVEPGHMVLAMILDTLTGRSPLYHLESFFESQDIELLLGKRYGAKSFNDDNLARFLDKIFDAGTMKIFTEVAISAARVFSLEKRYVHFDTTSLMVHGDYDPHADDPFVITFGHSKDHRPDLKQFVLSMLCVDGNVPIFGNTEDGNSSDKTLNNVILSEISCRMAKHGLGKGAYIYVADSALVTETNLQTLEGTLFITRLPSTYNECGRAITEAVTGNAWQDLGRIAKTKPTKHRPGTFYKVHETEVNLYGKSYRAVVVHSSAHDKRRQKRIDRELKEDRKIVQSLMGDEASRKYFCRPDAEAAAKRLSKLQSKYHDLSIEILEQPKYARGRPKNGEPRQVKEIHYALAVVPREKTEAVATKREEAGCFVLLSNVPKEGELAHTEAEILKVYKEQHGIEQNFAFLKDPVIVNSIFIKKPHRIEALGLVLLLALLIWRLMERSLRKHVETSKTKLTGLNKRLTESPTSYMITTTFRSVMVIKAGNQRKLARPLSRDQYDYLRALDLNFKIFTIPKPPG